MFSLGCPISGKHMKHSYTDAVFGRMFQFMQIFAILGWMGYRVSVVISWNAPNFWWKNHSGFPTCDHLLKPLLNSAQQMVAVCVCWVWLNWHCWCWCPPPFEGWVPCQCLNGESRVLCDFWGWEFAPDWAAQRCPGGAAVPRDSAQDPGGSIVLWESVPGEELCCGVDVRSAPTVLIRLCLSQRLNALSCKAAKG